MSNQSATLRDSLSDEAARAGADEAHILPGLLLVFSMGQPKCVALPLQNGQIELGRGDGRTLLPGDPKMSRRHTTVTFDGARFHITDHGSQNGTFVDSIRLSQSVSTATAQVVRTGDSIFLLVADLRPLRSGVQSQTDRIIGPALRTVFEQAARAAQFGHTLHITGESGSGKEGVARAFHGESKQGRGPFVAINCATIAPGIAERILFGARRGAFTGALADTDGLIQAADGGTLFLDEIAELDLAVQAKLLRVLETSEVLPMGALRPRPINIQLCSASHRDLRAEVSAGRFREDLYYRVNSPEVIVPPLRRRKEEISWLIEHALGGFQGRLIAHSTFVEACLLRHWPGNVRELLAEVRAAAQAALGRNAERLEAQHLGPRAGQPFDRPAEPPASCALFLPPSHPIPKAPLRELPGRDRVQEALHKTGGNISATARLLGLHRTQLKRLLDKLEIRTHREDQISEEEPE